MPNCTSARAHSPLPEGQTRGEGAGREAQGQGGTTGWPRSLPAALSGLDDTGACSCFLGLMPFFMTCPFFSPFALSDPFALMSTCSSFLLF